MDKVYSNATLTIVAAGGDNANAGLARLNSTTGPNPEPNVMIEGALLVTSIQPGALSLEGVKWDSRGWTYQEAALSRRSIIFMENSMCWHCPNGVHEDHAPLYINDDKQATALHHFGSATMPISQNKEGLKGFVFYENHVNRYNQRKLTKQEDALNAISAIVSYLKRELDTRFLWGLPTRWFDLAMLWRCTHNNPGTYRRRLAFPSWSWLGAKGPTIDFGSSLSYQEAFQAHWGTSYTSSITWPWKDQIERADFDESLSTGILNIQVELARIEKPAQLVITLNGGEERLEFDRQDTAIILDDASAWESGSMLCIKLGHFVRDRSTNSRPIPVDGTFLLILQLGADNIFYRVGCVCIPNEDWARADCKLVDIKLG